MTKIYRKTDTIKAEQFDGSNEMVDKYELIDAGTMLGTHHSPELYLTGSGKVDVAVKSNYPIDIERVKELVGWNLHPWTKQVIIESPLADENWEGGDTVGDLINDLKKLPEDMPVEYDYAGMLVETVCHQGPDDETLYLYSALVVSD